MPDLEFPVTVMKQGAAEGKGFYAHCWDPVPEDVEAQWPESDAVVYIRTYDAGIAAQFAQGRKFRVRLEPLDN